MNRKNRILKSFAILFSCIILFIALYFIRFEATHEIHTCTGTDCPICHELQLATHIIKQFNAGAILSALSFLCILFIKCIQVIFVCSYQERTLIVDKVRLDD